jgi:hypothetical protein
MPHDLAPMIVMVTGIITAGAVILFRPLTSRLGGLIHAMTEEKLRPGAQREVVQLHEVVARLESRLSLLEERQGFTESILDGKTAVVGERPSLAHASNGMLGSGVRDA